MTNPKQPVEKAKKPKTTWTCECGRTAESTGQPRGWKIVTGDKPICEVCLAGAWHPRSISLPVAKVLGTVDHRGKFTPLAEEVAPHKFVEPAWKMSTMLANWTRDYLIRHDVQRTPDMIRLPAYPLKGNMFAHWRSAYPETFQAAWKGAAGAAEAVIRDVEQQWKGKDRISVLWKNEAHARTYNYPYPYPGRAGDVKLFWQSHPGGDIPCLSLPFPDGRVVLSLDRQPALNRQLRDFSKLVTGQAKPGDVKLVPVRSNGYVCGVRAVIAGWFPRPPAKEAESRVATVTTAPTALLTVEVPDRKDLWVLYGAHVRGMLKAHATWLSRAAHATTPDTNKDITTPEAVKAKAELAAALTTFRSQLEVEHQSDDLVATKAGYAAWLERYRTDLKYEKRWPSTKRRRWVTKAQGRIEHHNNRIKTEINQIAAAVVGYVKRQKCGTLVYDDAVQTFLKSWPWYNMRTRLEQVCVREGVTFRHQPTPTEVKAKPTKTARKK